MWATIGLPVPRIAAAGGEIEALRCLNLLLSEGLEGEEDSIRGTIEDAMEGNDKAAANLRKSGIVVEAEGFLVMNRHPALARIYTASEWANFGWAMTLRRLAGAIPRSAVRDGALISRAVFLPDTLLDWRSNDVKM